MKFSATLMPGEDNQIIAECPLLRGCVSQGKTREEALFNIREAIRGYTAVLRELGEPLPEEDVVQVEVAV